MNSRNECACMCSGLVVKFKRGLFCSWIHCDSAFFPNPFPAELIYTPAATTERVYVHARTHSLSISGTCHLVSRINSVTSAKLDWNPSHTAKSDIVNILITYTPMQISCQQSNVHNKTNNLTLWQTTQGDLLRWQIIVVSRSSRSLVYFQTNLASGAYLQQEP